MTQPDQLTSDPEARMASRSSRHLEGAAPAVPAPPEAPPACLWDDLFHRAPPGLQRSYLARAGQHGVLYTHQLDDLARPGPPGAGFAALLAQLDGLPPLHCLPADDLPADLDPQQRDAVARALETPDLCLVQGLPGTGKTRVAAEVVRAAAARGQRLLVAAASPAAVDRLLGQLAGLDLVCPVRCLEAGEALESLAPAVRRMVFGERVRHFHEQTVHGARQALQEARLRL